MQTQEALELILKELERAKTIHPNWVDDYIHGAGIVCEESGELIRAALDHKYDTRELSSLNKEKMKEEAVHTAATAIRFLENF